MDVVMPQMGESVAEGTIVRWMKKVGDTVDSDEPLFEIKPTRSMRKSRRPPQESSLKSARRKAKPYR